MIKVQNLSFAYIDKPLFSEVNFTVGNKEKVALVGLNGAGKTTLFKLIIGQEYPLEGNINMAGNIELVPQEVKHDLVMEKSKSIQEYLDSGAKKANFELKKMLSKFGLENLNLDSQPKNLSGGQKTKLALARALLNEPDTLLLDEPTNFMDTAGKKWVMNFLSKYSKALILISHDIDLMDNSIDKVLYINQQTRKIDEYKGNYSKFKKLKEEREALAKRRILIQQKHIKSMTESLTNLKKHTSKKGVRQKVILRQRIEREIDKLPELPQEVKKIKINLPDPTPVGELPIRAINLSKSYGDRLIFRNMNFSLIRGEKLVLVGKNGVGKSTFIKILMGMIQPDSGEIIRNPLLKIGYYSQEFETFDLSMTLLDTITEKSRLSESSARSFLGRFNFMGDKVFQVVRSLSGGEKTRLSIAVLASQDFNLLILDEPTTYLDVMSQKIILDTIKAYKGTMILVSHSTEFVQEIAPTKAFLMPENKMVFWDDELLNKIADM